MAASRARALMLFRTLPARAVLGADSRLHSVLHRQRTAAQLLRSSRSDRIRRKPDRASRGGRGHAVSAQRDRLDQPVHPAGRLRHPARHDRRRPATSAQRQNAVGRSEENASIRSGPRATRSSARRPRAGTRRTHRGRRSIGTGSGATTLAIRTAPTSGRPVWPTVRSK